MGWEIIKKRKEQVCESFIEFNSLFYETIYKMSFVLFWKFYLRLLSILFRLAIDRLFTVLKIIAKYVKYVIY